MKALLWLKTNWKWIIAPVGILLWIAGRATAKKTVKVVSPQLVEHMLARQRLDDEAAAKRLEVETKHTTEVRAIDADYVKKVQASQASATANVGELQQDPDKLTAFLKKTGKDAGIRTKG